MSQHNFDSPHALPPLNLAKQLDSLKAKVNPGELPDGEGRPHSCAGQPSVGELLNDDWQHKQIIIHNMVLKQSLAQCSRRKLVPQQNCSSSVNNIQSLEQ